MSDHQLRLVATQAEPLSAAKLTLVLNGYHVLCCVFALTIEVALVIAGPALLATQGFALVARRISGSEYTCDEEKRWPRSWSETDRSLHIQSILVLPLFRQFLG
jgi:hypothetical protein